MNTSFSSERAGGRINLFFLPLLLLFASCYTNDVPRPDPSVSLSVDPLIISEDRGTATLTATLSGLANEDVSIAFTTSGTATATDYAVSTLLLSIPLGSTSAVITITAVQDTVEEGNETLNFSIESMSGAIEQQPQEVSLTIEDDDAPIVFQLVLNEICYDPSNSGLNGDTNGDGSYAQREDEFLEFVNLSSMDFDLSGYQIYDAENLAISSPNHTIPANTIVPAGGVLVIFGGGTPTGSFGGGLVQTSTSGDLNLNNSGDVMYLYDPSGQEVLSFDIEPLSNNPNESYTRSPDLTGDFVQHSSVTAGVLFSPGTKADGTPF